MTHFDSSAGLRELNEELVIFYDCPEYRQLFAGYHSLSGERPHMDREAFAAQYARYQTPQIPNLSEWRILEPQCTPGPEMLHNADQRTKDARLAIVSEYEARLLRGFV